MMQLSLALVLVATAAASRDVPGTPKELDHAMGKADTLQGEVERVGAPAAAPGGAPGGPSPLGGIQGFVDLLPYSPDRMNYQMAKSRCIDFVNHMLDKAGHDATILPKLMPKCLWSKEDCATLEADLLSRIPDHALPGGGAPAGAPVPGPAAASFLTTHSGKTRSPGSGDAVFGWCDTLYNMAKTRHFANYKPKGPEPGMAPLPTATGNVHADVHIMNNWADKHLPEEKKASLVAEADAATKPRKHLLPAKKVGHPKAPPQDFGRMLMQAEHEWMAQVAGSMGLDKARAARAAQERVVVQAKKGPAPAPASPAGAPGPSPQEEWSPLEGLPQDFSQSCLHITQALLFNSDGDSQDIGEYMNIVCATPKSGADVDLCHDFRETLMGHLHPTDSKWNRNGMDLPLFCKGFFKVMVQHIYEYYPHERAGAGPSGAPAGAPGGALAPPPGGPAPAAY